MPNTLLLIPTDSEYAWAADLLSSLPPEIVVGLCGFGPVVAGVRTAQLISRYHPKEVWLVGIAGAFHTNLELGEACEFDQVACYGIGVGSGSRFRTASEMGWCQWAAGSGAIDSPLIQECLQLDSGRSSKGKGVGQLLTVCAASADRQDVERRTEKFPLAVAEDMEGFAVATACVLAQVPVRIIRGFSNMAGDRDHRNWKSSAAMQSAVVKFISHVAQRP